MNKIKIVIICRAFLTSCLSGLWSPKVGITRGGAAPILPPSCPVGTPKPPLCRRNEDGVLGSLEPSWHGNDPAQPHSLLWDSDVSPAGSPLGASHLRQPGPAAVGAIEGALKGPDPGLLFPFLRQEQIKSIPVRLPCLCPRRLDITPN